MTAPAPLITIGRLPNLRELIIPDPGMIIVDMDLDRADLWVLQRECNDERLREKLEAERKDKAQDIHTANALDIFGKSDYEKRRFAKVFCHGKNYGATSPALSKQCGISIKAADTAGEKWFAAHPGIPTWQVRVKNQIYRTHQIKNKFGFRRHFFSRVDDAYTQALAWVPASTVALVVHYAFCNIEENLPWVQILMNGHDSLTMQVPEARLEESLPLIEREAKIVVPYQEPLIIPVGFSVSKESWGKVEELKGYQYAA